jgi:SPP1 gp7 family putative phage head morphogenesis protein
LGHWPQPWELYRLGRLHDALVAAQEALAKLGERAGVTVSDAAGNAVEATADIEPRLIASQLPAAERPAAVEQFTSRILPTSLDVIVARSQARIVALTRPLSDQAMEVMRRELVRGVAEGLSPRETARQMLKRTEGAFNGGLSRALNIARTEVLDAYRTASAQAHAANADVLQGWVWSSTLDKRTCPSCWSKHGTVHPLDEPGPQDHQSGRCARIPKLRSWKDLGIDLDEPPDTLPDAKAKFAALSQADQLAIMGPARLELLKSGEAKWEDLATRRSTTGWRDSWAPTPVKDLGGST